MLAEDLRARMAEPGLRDRVQLAMERLLHDVNESLAEYERLALLVVAGEPWSVENGLLTPTLKIRRNRIEAAMAPQIEAWYARGQRVVWA